MKGVSVDSPGIFEASFSIVCQMVHRALMCVKFYFQTIESRVEFVRFSKAFPFHGDIKLQMLEF